MNEGVNTGTGLLIPGFRSSTWMSLDATSERRENRIEGFGGRVLRLPTVLLQQLFDTGTKVLS